MTDQPILFKDVTLLITHYNRSKSLARLLLSFQDLNCRFGDIVISDDGSKPEHVEFIKSLHEHFSFRLITTEKNKGLGNNINKGQDAVKTKYTLYVQEDFDPTPLFPSKLKVGIEKLEKRNDLDIVRFYAYSKYPYLTPVGDGFSEMNFNMLKPGYMKFYCYSDHPHLRRSNFFEKFGRYAEGEKVEKTEYLMMMSFLKHKGKGLQYENINDLFEQKNSSSEPSTVRRNFWREKENFVMNSLRHLYRHLKLNTDYLFK